MFQVAHWEFWERALGSQTCTFFHWEHAPPKGARSHVYPASRGMASLSCKAVPLRGTLPVTGHNKLPSGAQWVRNPWAQAHPCLFVMKRSLEHSVMCDLPLHAVHHILPKHIMVVLLLGKGNQYPECLFLSGCLTGPFCLEARKATCHCP